MKVLVTGASGLIGKRLICHLLNDGHEVVALARSPEKMFELPTENVFRWSDDQKVPLAAFAGVDAVVNLAGENIAGARWTAKRKERLVRSRCDGTRHLVAGIANLPNEKRPKTLISASAIGFYGETGDRLASEETPAGRGFLPDLCVAWEAEAKAAHQLGVRVVIPRFGVVLAQDGGALEKMGPAVLGTGDQWISWVHIDDLIRFLVRTLKESEFEGVYNLTSPNPVRQRDFVSALAKTLKYPMKVGVPAFALKLALGKMAEIVLDSQKIAPTRTLASGFLFEFSDIASALGDIYHEVSYLDHRLLVHQFVPLKREDLFQFFSRAENLETLTPPWLNFHIVKQSEPEISKGALIDYRITVRGMPMRWRTLISEWMPDYSFADDQVKGPYKKWHHLHTFHSVQGGTLLRDEVTFRLPGSVFGHVALTPLVRRDVESIFTFRRKKIRELFAGPPT